MALGKVDASFKRNLYLYSKTNAYSAPLYVLIGFSGCKCLKIRDYIFMLCLSILCIATVWLNSPLWVSCFISVLQGNNCFHQIVINSGYFAVVDKLIVTFLGVYLMQSIGDELMKAELNQYIEKMLNKQLRARPARQPKTERIAVSKKTGLKFTKKH